MTYRVTKTYSPDNGWSATFRQWRAESHCRFEHGYALGNRVSLSCPDHERDKNGWVFDFGGLKPYKAWLQETFDHKYLAAFDDPMLERFREDERLGLKQLVVVERVGCEGFAKLCHDKLLEIIEDYNLINFRSVQIDYVEVFEHSGNSATYIPDGVSG
jgi:6-pyruvoyltetrahydropterin/6-carboxytetrahydropterin synthase